MGEHVIVRQNNQFEIEFWAADPEAEEEQEPEPVFHIHELSPYGQLLTSLGSCTTIVLHTYAQNHKVALKEVTIDLQYDRIFREDCEDCEGIERYVEHIDEEITLEGNLTGKERRKLFQIAHQCSIHKIVEAGAQIESKLAD